MTTSITVRVNGGYVREVTIGEAAPVKVGPGNNVEKTFEHHECYDKDVHVGAERAATEEELAAAKAAEFEGGRVTDLGGDKAKEASGQ